MEDELYLENIDEFVTDQNRIVTYKWLSYTLGVHVNHAKQMLFEYVERKRKESSGAQLHVTYLLAGDLLHNGHLCHRVAVVREEQLEARRAKLASLCSLHIYSIQRAQLRDSAALYSTDYDITKANLGTSARFSAIHCASAVPRPPPAAPAGQALAHTVPKVPPGAPSSAGTVSQLNGQTACGAKQQPKGIMGMFARKVAPREKESSRERAEGKEPAAVAAGSRASAKSVLGNFFGKAALSKLRGTSVPEQPKEEEKEQEEEDSAPAAVPGCSRAVPRPGEEAEAGRSQCQDNKRKLKRQRQEEQEEEEEQEEGPEPSGSSRKRLRGLQSHSSEEEGAQQPPPAEEAPRAEPAGTEQCPQRAGRRRRRQRVLKSKMFIDEEEGCMVTEKVYESESCSDSQEEPCSPVPALPAQAPALPPAGQPKEQRRGQKRGAAAGTRATKQPSIVGFFHRK